MTNLSLRKLDDETFAKLRARAAQHGISVEEEARQILQDAVSAPARIGDLALRIFGPQHGVEVELPKRDAHEPMDFSA